eukprot:555454_1
MNEHEWKKALKLIQNEYKATKHYYYEMVYKVLDERAKINNESERQIIRQKATFSHHLDLLLKYECPHSFYNQTDTMIDKLHFKLLNEPKQYPQQVYNDLYNGHICKDCALDILIKTNNLKSFEEHIQKFGNQYQPLFDKRPISMCNELMSLWQITLFFIQILNFPSIMKLFMRSKQLFQRILLLTHWFSDRWASLSNLKQTDMTKENDPCFHGATIYNVAKYNEYSIMIHLYALISHCLFYWKCRHIQWYLEIKSLSIFKQYVMDELQRRATSSILTSHTQEIYI